MNNNLHVKKIEILSRLIKESAISKEEAFLLLSDEDNLNNDKLEEFKQSIKAKQYTNAYFNLGSTTSGTTTSSYIILNNIPIKTLI